MLAIFKLWDFDMNRPLQGLFWKSIREAETGHFGLISEDFDPF